MTDLITIRHENGNTVTGTPEQVLNYGHLQEGWKYVSEEEPESVEETYVRVWGIFPPYRVMQSTGNHSEDWGPADIRYILYREDVEVTRLETRFLKETDEAQRQLRQAATLYEHYRIMRLAMTPKEVES